MCGICGIIGDAEKKEEVLERMMEAIRHRGPDGGDAYLSRNAALGFRRLSIIDLEQGMQPMYNETGSKVLLFNGEIYNYRELREELVSAALADATTASNPRRAEAAQVERILAEIMG